MTDFLRDLLATEGFHPHGYCYLWKPGLVWLHVISDSLIGIAYIGIGMTLAHFVRRGSGDLPFSRIFVAFGVFIAACGATHFMEIWTLWSPVYWLSGSVKVVTAAASVATAVVLPPLVPLALGTIRSARLSDRRKAELEHTNTELASANDQLHHLYDRLKEADEAKTRFFANVSHELRTPLTLILGPTERMLAGSGLAAADRQHLETVRRNASLLLRHVNELLDIQKVDAGQMPVHYARMDLARAVHLWAAHFESVAEERGIGFSVETPDSVPAEADPDKLGRALLNLLSNAFKFTPDGGRVRCVVRVADGVGAEPAESLHRVVIEVHDSGPGIPPHQREIVFEPFRQIDDAPTRRFGGTGLGLAIVRDFVELHGGSVSIGDSPEGGALFRVELPIHAPAGATIHQPELDVPGGEPALPGAVQPHTPQQTIGDEADGAKPLVLVVEDNPEMNAFVAGTLSAEYRVVTAPDGRAGVDRAREIRPDLILSDIMMPEMSGDALVRELRRDPALDAVPILLLSARADDELRIRLLREGAQDYLTKPFSVEELRARVSNWTAMKRARDILRRELDSTIGDVEQLAGDMALRKRELDSALEATRLALSEAREANRAKSDFLSVMSHELRTPLNAITGYTDLLEMELEGSGTPAQRNRLERIRASSNHLLGLVEQILTYARAEAGREQIHVEPLDMGEAVRETAELLTPAAAAKGLSLDTDVPPEPVLIHSDAGKIRQILLNLADNAVKFTERGGVSIVLRANAADVILRVRDSGPGIAAEHREKIFEPFWQADASKTRTAGGTGLGLSIVRTLTQLLGGDVEVDSRPGEGTEFTVRLPRHPQV